MEVTYFGIPYCYIDCEASVIAINDDFRVGIGFLNVCGDADTIKISHASLKSRHEVRIKP